jgi:hypothetical protein
MTRLRKRFSIARLLAAVAIVATNLGIIRHATIALISSAAMLIPVFISGLALIEIGIVVVCAFIAVVLLIPPVESASFHVKRRKTPATKAITAPTPSIPPPTAGPPTSRGESPAGTPADRPVVR